MAQSANATAVANYNLYGEYEDLPDVAHVETIQARSRLTDWKFPAHRHARLHQVLLLDSGSGVADIEGQRFELKPVVAVNVPTGVVHGYRFAPDTDGLVITLVTEMVDKALEPSKGLREVIARPGMVVPDAALVAAIRQVAEEYARRDFARAQILHGLSGVLLGRMARALATGREIDLVPAEPDRLRQFEMLLEAHYHERWRVSDYAAALGITPVHLTRLTRAATGKSASALIDERIVREARRSLVYTDLPVATIAYSLGFADPAYFSRVFSRVTGLPPGAVRAAALRD